jgi:hypothetical protein
MRTGGRVVTKGVPNKVNEDFFFTWTSELAYVLGLLATDGYIGDKTGNKKAHQIQLSLIDKEIIDAVTKVIGYEGRIYTKQPKGFGTQMQYAIKFGNKRVFERLIELKITPRKTYTLEMPPIPDGLFSHFFRGVFDGDGTVCESKGSNRMVRIVGVSPDFQYGLQERVNKLINVDMRVWINKRYDVPQQIVYTSGYGNLALLYDWMYSGATNNLWIPRKREKLKRIIAEWTHEIRGHGAWELRNFHKIDELIELHCTQKIPLKKIASMWGVPYISVRNIAKEWGVACNRYGLGSRQHWLSVK